MAEDVKIFGMPAESGRWIMIFWGFVVNLCLGSVYAWSVFKKPLIQLWSCSATESGNPFMVFLIAFAIFMPLTGGYLDKYGPRLITVIGGIIVALGWILSSYAPHINALTLTYGVIAGIGVGIAYGCPIAVSTRWFPDKKGLAVGLTVAGFGLSAMITAPLMRKLIETNGCLSTFGIMGVIFLVILVVSALFLKFPPSGWKPKGWTPPAASTACPAVNCNRTDMLKTGAFWGLWFCYIIGTLAGLMAIGISSPVGQEVVKLDPATAAALVSVFAIFNGGGRPIFGWLTDKISPKNAAVLSFVIIFLASIGMAQFAGEGKTILYILCFCGFWLALGGWLAIAPTATATLFGTQYYAKNYGIVFTAYGMGALFGSIIAGKAKDIMGSYTPAFYPTAALAVIGIIIAMATLKPIAAKK
ncbi:MAG: OFA family MFS transporter [bacterium]|nr:OFA family MFS transporter [bacterium]